ncbi:MAG: transcriptional regulator [Candidatus Bathyarchaeia archaeon]
MKPPCMIVTASILPALRVEIAGRLIRDYKLKPIEVARRMDVTPAAVTQYVKGSRGKADVEGLLRDGGVEALVSALASKLAEGSTVEESMEALCQICEALRRRGLLCPQCRAASQTKTLKGCSFCTG